MKDGYHVYSNYRELLKDFIKLCPDDSCVAGPTFREYLEKNTKGKSYILVREGKYDTWCHDMACVECVKCDVERCIFKDDKSIPVYYHNREEKLRRILK